MSISNSEIFVRLQALGLNPPTINEKNRMYALALIYNSEIDQSMDKEEMRADNYKIEDEDTPYKEQRLISPKTVCQLNWSHYFENTKQDIESGLRYAVTQWEGDQNNVLAEFKRMRLSDNPDEDERILQIQTIIEKIFEEISIRESKANEYDENDDNELARLSDIFEKEYYGYVSDSELVQAMDRLLNISDAKIPQENISDLQIVSEKIAPPSSLQTKQMDQCQDEDSDEYY